MKLIYKGTDKPVQVGDSVTVRDGAWTVDSCPKPHKPDSGGKVYLKNAAGGNATFYCSVIGAEWIDREDRAADV